MENAEKLPLFDGGHCTVYRAECDLGKLPKAAKAVARGRFRKPVPMARVAPEGHPEADAAHPPLEIFDPCPADMNGPEAMLVAMEYMRPYEHSLAVLDAQDAGLDVLQSFECGSIAFERVAPFGFGTAHTFDTLLATMYDRYEMDFEQTAWLAESLYLGGGAI